MTCSNQLVNEAMMSYLPLHYKCIPPVVSELAFCRIKKMFLFSYECLLCVFIRSFIRGFNTSSTLQTKIQGMGNSQQNK